MSNRWFESPYLEVRGKDLDTLYKMKAKLYKERDRVRKDIIGNGAETFIKYGPEFTHKIDNNLSRVKEEIERQEATSQHNQMLRNRNLQLHRLSY